MAEGAGSGSDFSVYLNPDFHVILSDDILCGRSAEDFAEEFANWQWEDTAADRKLGEMKQRSFFQRVLTPDSSVAVVGINEFPYTHNKTLEGPARQVERELWIRDFTQVEWVLLHVHYEGTWSEDWRRRNRSVILQCNLRHSVTAKSKPEKKVFFRKCEDMSAWREAHGCEVKGLPSAWHWREQGDKHPALHRLLMMGEKCHNHVRALEAPSTIGHSPSDLPPRHALLIHVGLFVSEDISPLCNTRRDAESVKGSLENLGWDVEMLDNPAYRVARKKLKEFIDRSEHMEDACMIAFFGHGFEFEGENFLMMQDTKRPQQVGRINIKECLQSISISVSWVLDRLKDSRRQCGYPVTLVLLDCCRTPLSFMPVASPVAQGRSFGVGGCQFDNLVVICSTSSGNTASDGVSGGNSPFIESFHRKILQPGRTITDILMDIRKDIGQQQLSPEVSALLEPFYFLPAPVLISDPSAGVGSERLGGSSDAGSGGENAPEIREVKTWLESIPGLVTQEMKDSVWHLLEGECFLTLKVIKDSVEEIKGLEGFKNLKAGSRKAFSQALEVLKEGTVSQTSATTPCGAVQEGERKVQDFERNMVFLKERDDIAGLVRGMQEHCDHAGIQEKGCEILRDIAENGDIEAIVKGMTRHQESAGVQEHGRAALGNLAVNADNKVVIAELGGIEAIIKGMTRHQESAGVQEHGSAALRCLAVNADQNKVVIAELGGIEAIVQGMTRHQESAGVQEHGSAALRCLAVNADQNKVVIAELGGIEAIVNGMGRHQESAGVQEHGSAALRCLAFIADNQVKIAARGGIEAIVKGMGRHQESAGVQELGSGALRSLAFNADNQVKIAELGGIEAIVNGMGRHQESAGVQEQGCAALVNLTAIAGNEDRIAELGGIEAIVKGMGRHQESAGVQESGTMALLNIGWSNRSLQRQIKNAGAEVLVQRAISASNATSKTKEKGTDLLGRLNNVGLLKGWAGFLGWG